MSGHTLDKLIYMANQIAREFENQQPKHAADATWDHIWHYWNSRMQGMIIGYMQADGSQLRPTARQAIERLVQPVEPASQTKATEFNQANDHNTDRNLMSDAG